MAEHVNRLILGITPREWLVRGVAATTTAVVGLLLVLSGLYWAIVACPIAALVGDWLIKRRFRPRAPMASQH